LQHDYFCKFLVDIQFTFVNFLKIRLCLSGSWLLKIYTQLLSMPAATGLKLVRTDDTRALTSLQSLVNWKLSGVQGEGRMKFEDFFQRVVRVTDVRSQKQLADLLGVGPAAITLAKTRGVPRSWSFEIASIFGLNPGWIKTGQGPVYQSGREETFFVPKLSARAGAGGGSFDVSQDVVDEIPFSAAWVQKKGSPGSMVIMEVVGDSMYPELEEGDNILVDESQKFISSSGLYVMGLDDSLQVKRIQSQPGLVILLSANRNYPPVSLQGDEIDTLRVIGKVLWSGREYQ
jgi:SOS-response transcriptional repressor LexA